MSQNEGVSKRTWSVRGKGQGRIGGEIAPFAFEQRVIIPTNERIQARGVGGVLDRDKTQGIPSTV